MSISVLTTNVFPGQDHVRVIMTNLGDQTHKDFEWVFVDAYHDENRVLVADLARKYGLRRVTHVPACTAKHVGHKFHWDLYNTALLLSSEPIFLRLGVFRYFHNQIVEKALQLGQNDTWISLRQREVKDFDAELAYHEQAQRHKLEVTSYTPWNQLVSHCGMFSFSRERMLRINGNNEALLIHHWEDVDLNCRSVHLGQVNLMSLENAFLRVWHSKSNPYLSKDTCCSLPCIVYAPNSHELQKCASAETEWTIYRGFPWARCRTCHAVAVGYCDKYFEYLKSEPQALIAPIGVFGVGRDIRILDEDLKRLPTLESKLELLTTSHTDPRYLKD